MPIDPMLYRAVTLKAALQIHVRTGGKMRLTRTATPTALLRMASEFTGVQYKRGQHQQALTDLVALLTVNPAVHLEAAKA